MIRAERSRVHSINQTTYIVLMVSTIWWTYEAYKINLKLKSAIKYYKQINGSSWKHCINWFLLLNVLLKIKYTQKKNLNPMPDYD